MPRLRHLIFLGVLMVFSTACSFFGIRTVEQTPYQVLEKEGEKEIRQYPEHIVAKTTVQGEFKESQNEAFRILAGYIFGKNKGKQDIAMTAPVVQKQTPKSEKVAMTAPVVQKPSENGWTMTFMMPSEYKKEDLPIPNDPRVSFEVIKPRLVAAITYSWGASSEKNEKKAKELSEWLAKSNYELTSSPMYAGYDPPWTLPPLRRNEMLIEIQRREE